LAKRSHFCQKVIKRLKEELQEATLANAAQTGKIGNGHASASHTPRVMNYKGGVRNMMLAGTTGVESDLARGNEDLINFLE
jgi:hypothetical protein